MLVRLKYMSDDQRTQQKNDQQPEQKPRTGFP